MESEGAMTDSSNDNGGAKGRSRRISLGELGDLLYRNLRVIIMVVTAVVVLWMLEELGTGEIMKLDAAAYSLFVETLRNDALTPLMTSVTELAAPVSLVIVWVVAAAFAPGRRPGIAMALNLGGAVLINQVLKSLVHRPRPEGFRLIDETGYSFPSGHSMVAMAFYGFLVYLIWHYEKDNVKRWLWCCCLSLTIVGIGVSRVYLGVHYASDVLAGFLISLAWLALFTKLVCPLLLPEEDANPSGAR